MYFAIAYFTGHRISEVLSLDISDIGSNSILIRRANTKTNKTRTANLVLGLKPFLEVYDAPESRCLLAARHNSKSTKHIPSSNRSGA